jgi:hypothetical protein
VRRLVPQSGWLAIDIVESRARRDRHSVQGFWKLDHPFYWTAESLRLALYRTGWVPVWEGFRSPEAYLVIAQPKSKQE